MATIDELTAQYLSPIDGAGLPKQFNDSLVTPIVDADNFNLAIIDALNLVGTGTKAQNIANEEFILIHNWWLALLGADYRTGADLKTIKFVKQPPYTLDGPKRKENLDGTGATIGGGDRLINRIIDKAKLGVDVRVMGWITSGITQAKVNSHFAAFATGDQHAATLRSIAALRKEASIGFKAITNEVAHSVGAAHIKMVVVGSKTAAVGFTGGLDFVLDRWAKKDHLDWFDTSDSKRKNQNWHDVVAKVQGPAVEGLYEWFRALWTEVISRKMVRYKIRDVTTTPTTTRVESHGDKAPKLTPPLGPIPLSPIPAAGAHRAQSLRTAHQANYGDVLGSDPKVFHKAPALSFAPSGLQECRAAMQKAIAGARQYIYLEDQAFYSREVMKYIHDALKAQTALRVILLAGGDDPNDKERPDVYFPDALYTGLFEGRILDGDTADPLTDPQKDRVRIYRRLSETSWGTGTITQVAPQPGGIIRVTVSILNLPPGYIANAFADAPPGESDFVDPDKLLTRDTAQIRQGGNVFAIVANPRMILGEDLTFDVRPGAFDIFTTGTPTLGTFEMFRMEGIVMHSKALLVDDVCAMIGSANVMRRSLYTDLEHSVAFVDAAAQTTIKQLRCDLWADQFRHPTPADFADVTGGLHAWNRQWFTAGSAPPRPPHIIQLDIPNARPSRSLTDRAMYDTVFDNDSREPLRALNIALIQAKKSAP